MSSALIGGVGVSDTNIIHNSASAVYRDPPGAICAGTEITLALRLFELYAESVILCVLRGDSVERVVMEREQDGLLRARYLAPFSADRQGTVLWYWFELALPGGALCYYGAEPPYPSGLGRVYRDLPPAFQITVYSQGFDTPSWARSAVMYQIFPDRFCMGDPGGVRAGIDYHRGLGRLDIELHNGWDDTPVYEARPGQADYVPNDIFGGDLEGIRLRLGYLATLGVTLIYLNPIFEAASNHRYNTADYRKIDPILGDNVAFRRLVAEAQSLGMRIILDGVFSHTGDDSRYFNKYGRYEALGACQGKDSPYLGWYSFDEYPDRYSRWWGFETLPEVNEHDPGWREYVVTGQDSVIRHWLDEGVAGYRLDVADELPDEVIELIRSTVKEADPEAFLLGEVWEDATTKVSYGSQRSYALGRGLDSVMNYPFLNRTIEFVTGKIDARFYQRFLLHQQQVYPAPMYYALMNHVSSHDVCRVRSLLSRDWDLASMSRQQQAQATLTEDEFRLGGFRQRLVAAIQYSLPGIPAVYYGDEVGMTGLLDPFNRRTWRIEDPEMLDWYVWLGNLRRTRPVLSTGFARFFATNGKVLGILRDTVSGCDYFGREMDLDAVLTLINPTDEPQRIVLDMKCDKGGGTGGRFSCDKGTVNLTLFREKVSSLPSPCHRRTAPLSRLPCHTDNGLMEVSMQPCSVEILSLEQ